MAIVTKYIVQQYYKGGTVPEPVWYWQDIYGQSYKDKGEAEQAYHRYVECHQPSRWSKGYRLVERVETVTEKTLEEKMVEELVIQ